VRIPAEWRYGSLKGRLFRKLMARRGAALVVLDGQTRQDLAVVHETRRRLPLLMQDAAALQIMACARAARQLGGSMAEAGVFMGGSARLICEAKGDAPLHLYDAFEFLQGDLPDRPEARTLRDYFGSFHSRLEDVKGTLSAYPHVQFHPGHFPQSADRLAEEERFSFVHLDLDLAEGTFAALELFWPRMLPGGVVIGDDYNLPAVRGAFERYFAEKPEKPVALLWSQAMVVKNSA